MTLSSNKLARLEAPMGVRDPAGALLKEVLVREAVRSAWASLEGGPSDLTDWRAPTALGLDTLTEEDEEEEEDAIEAAEAAWLDDVLSSFGDERPATSTTVATEQSAAWAETTVLRPEADDFDYDDDAVQAFTLPSMSSSMDIEEADALIGHSLSADVTVVEVAAVDDESDYSDYDENMTTSWIELDTDYSHKGEIEHVEDVDVDSDSDVSLASPLSHSPLLSPMSEDSEPEEGTDVFISPATNALLQAIPFALRPRLVRAHAHVYHSYSAENRDVDVDCFECDDSTCPDLIDPGERGRPHCNEDENYESDDDDDSPCRTPPLMSCDQLEVVASGKTPTFWSEGVDWNLDALTI
jgi:hypothetical protein